MLFDSHAHLDDEKFDGERSEVVARALAGGVAYILNAGSCMESSARAVALAKTHPAIYAAVGIHPHDAAKMQEEDAARLLAWAKEPKVVAIGEIGLDYHYDFSPRDVQRRVFARQMELARTADLPIIVHDREAHADVAELIRQHGRGLQGVLHCYSGSLEMAREYVKQGFYISVAGPLTFKNAARLPEVVREIPRDRLLIETDCPYLTPHPLRGKRNEPAYVRLVAEKVAELLGLEWQAVAELTTANARRLFRI